MHRRLLIQLIHGTGERCRVSNYMLFLTYRSHCRFRDSSELRRVDGGARGPFLGTRALSVANYDGAKCRHLCRGRRLIVLLL